MKNIKSFKLFENVSKIVYRAIKRDYDKNYNEIQYYAENPQYARIFGDKVMQFYLNCDEKYIMDLDKWNSKLSKDTLDIFNTEHLFAIHSTYLNPESDDYAYKGLTDYIFLDLGKEEFMKFNEEFLNAKVIKGRDSGNESQKVYAVRDKSVILKLS